MSRKPNTTPLIKRRRSLCDARWSSLCGRPGDLLRLRRETLKDDGIEVRTSKTGKALIIEWSPALRRAVKRARTQRPQVQQALISNRQGKPYTVDGFNTVFHRAMGKALEDAENPLTERFQFRDLLPAKSASDDNAEAASNRLGHASPAITEKVYRREAERVKPLR